MPDGGCSGWIVVLCCFYGQMACTGALLSLGVFYSSWVEDFDASRGLTSWVVGMCIALGNMVGPAAASLVYRFGHRTVIMAGALICSSAVFLSAFVTSIYWLVVLIGLFGGLGFGLVYLPSNSIIPLYFHKRRSLALGIVLCGVGFGSFLYPPCLAWLENRIHWRGSLMIMSGLMLNVVVCGALIRPVDSRTQQTSPVNKKHSKNDARIIKTNPEERVSSGAYQSPEERDLERKIETTISLKNGSGLATNQYPLLNTCSDKNAREMKFSKTDTTCKRVKIMNCENLGCNPSTIQSPASRHEEPGLSKHVLKGLDPSTFKLREETPVTNIPFNDAMSDTANVCSQTIAYTNGSWTIQYGYRFCGENKAKILRDASSDCNDFNSVLSNSENQTTTQPSFAHSESSQPPSNTTGWVSQTMFTIRLMKNPYFATFVVSNFFTCSTYLMPPVYLVDRAVENGVEKNEAAVALAMYGAGNMFGRVAFGALESHKSRVLDSLGIASISLVMCGVVTSLSPLCGDNAVLHGVYGFTFGTFIGGFVIMGPIILVEMLGESMLTATFGLTLMFRSLGLGLGTPVAGWIYDATGSYTVSFIIHGIVIGVSGLVLLGLKVALVRSKRCNAAAPPRKGISNEAFG